MKYGVFWSARAQQRLAAIWNSASDRQVVTDAANAIDRLLSYNPEQRGESRFGGMRILFSAPLGVLYTIDSQTRVVDVLTVWRFATRRR